jgi:hypothetical protein
MNITLETKSGKYLIKSDDNQFIMSELKTSTKEGSKSFGTEQECSKRYYPKLSQLVSALIETEMKTSDAFDLQSLVDTVCRIESCIITKIKEA